jgi:XTP/dITP diphosphohydrolase
MPRTLVVGTNNRYKLDEIAPLLDGLGLTLRTAGEYERFEPAEDGATLEENAILKAREALALSGEWSIADDTGLEVDALGGAPGVHAARYAGPGCTFADNVRKLLRALDGVPDQRRTARFVCVIALCRPGADAAVFRAVCPGRILSACRGRQGFGYDPVFLMDGLDKTFAELSLAEKNLCSHRARAARMLRGELEKLLAER